MHMPTRQYITSLRTGQIVWSPHGSGATNYRDIEAIYAGAAVLVDDHSGVLEGFPGHADPSARHYHYFSRNMPVIWWRGHRDVKHGLEWVDDTNVTAKWLEEQYAAVLARTDELDVAEIYWPYWLYHMFKAMPPDYG